MFRKRAQWMRRSVYSISLNEHAEDETAIVFQHACKLGLEASCRSGEGHRMCLGAHRTG